jgi:hypothetical protein
MGEIVRDHDSRDLSFTSQGGEEVHDFTAALSVEG